MASRSNSSASGLQVLLFTPRFLAVAFGGLVESEEIMKTRAFWRHFSSRCSDRKLNWTLRSDARLPSQYLAERDPRGYHSHL